MKTVLEHLKSIPDERMRNLALQDMDTRYADHTCYTLKYALTFGVFYKTETADNTKLWTDYINL